jgi:hypothetical protein
VTAGRNAQQAGRADTVRGMTKALVTDRIVGVIGAVGAGIGLWRFTSGAWIEGIALSLAVAAVAAFYLVRGRRRPRDTRRY